MDDVLKMVTQQKSCVACHTAAQHGPGEGAVDWKKSHDDVLRLLRETRSQR